VTTHARYFALHGLIASECARRDLTIPQAQNLLRRCEVVMGAASVVDGAGNTGLFARPHGAAAMQHVAGGDDLDVVAVSTPGSYAESIWGFRGPYLGAERVLGIVQRGQLPQPGKRYNDTAVRSALGAILELAAAPRLPFTAIEQAVPELSIYRCVGATDADWLATLLCSQETRQDRRRRATLQLMARVMDTVPVISLGTDVGAALAFGGFLTSDDFAAASEEAAMWHGVLLRNFSVGAWRRLWAWIVDQIVDGKAVTPDALARSFADELPRGSVLDLIAELPELVDSMGNPVPAEPALRARSESVPHRELLVLAAGARRLDSLTGVAGAIFARANFDDFDPGWMKARLVQAGTQSLRDFGAQLVRDMLAKSRRVAMRKAEVRDDGTLWIPSRLHQRGDELVAIAREGSGDVGTRLPQLGLVAAACGIFDGSGSTWRVTAKGRELLG
jgi:hypothetical protein